MHEIKEKLLKKNKIKIKGNSFAKLKTSITVEGISVHRSLIIYALCKEGKFHCASVLENIADGQDIQLKNYAYASAKVI